PLSRLSKVNESADTRHERRAFTPEEVTRLLGATEAAGVSFGMTGPERVLLYRLALETGLRYSEIRSLTRSSFAFDAKPATVFLAAQDAKNGRDATIMLREPLAAALADYMRLHAPIAPAFRMQDGKGAKMLKADCEAAGVDYVDEAGRYGDFHALRHTFITNLARPGSIPKLLRNWRGTATSTLPWAITPTPYLKPVLRR
ncbi:MAG: tyrosine-type recombinase/integrase, partial [Planctomycetaceae bacterium]|nr:tyrosine-type recombinase/integrase [Planctomycetaceae bacterium]